jgi:hypothetical protein
MIALTQGGIEAPEEVVSVPGFVEFVVSNEYG